jgi:hypothetical protein
MDSKLLEYIRKALQTTWKDGLGIKARNESETRSTGGARGDNQTTSFTHHCGYLGGLIAIWMILLPHARIIDSDSIWRFMHRLYSRQ